MCPTNKIVFRSVKQLIGIFCHHMKALILGNAFYVPVRPGDFLRARVFDDKRDKLNILCTLLNMGQGYQGVSSGFEKERGTDKHKLVWLIPVATLREARRHDGPTMMTPVVQGSNFWNEVVGLWGKGTLHVLTAASLAAGSWQLTITPQLEPSTASATEDAYCEYVALVLHWIGDSLFHYTAMQNALVSTNDDGSRRSPAQTLGPLIAILSFYPKIPPYDEIDEDGLSG